MGISSTGFYHALSASVLTAHTVVLSSTVYIYIFAFHKILPLVFMEQHLLYLFRFLKAVCSFF